MEQEPRRRYRSDLRATQAEATRRAILQAAEALALAGGWSGATIAAVADKAGVAKETVYAVFGSKPALIAEMVKAAVLRGQAGQRILEDPRATASGAERDLARQLDLWAAWLGEILARVAPLMEVVRTGAGAEPEMATLYRALHQGRRENLAAVARSLHALGPLRGGATVEAVTDILWHLASPELFTLATRVAGRSAPEFAAGLAHVLKAALLPP